jgi:hypothetical protein
MSLGLFIAGYGFMYHTYWISGIGVGITFIAMFLRSVYDDHGWHIEPEELEEKGVKV